MAGGGTWSLGDVARQEGGSPAESNSDGDGRGRMCEERQRHEAAGIGG